MSSGTARNLAPLVLLRTWLLPLAAGAAAVGVHYALHVPAGPLPPPSPAQLEEAKKAADKKKKDDEAAQREADRKAGKVRPRSERASVRELPYEPFRQPRPAHIIEQLWAYYEPMAFKREPTFEAWQTAHKPLLAQVVAATRHTATPDAPAIDVTSNECHTIRCRLTLTAPAQEPLDALIAALQQLQLDGGPLWHSFEVERLAADKADRAAAKAGITPPVTPTVKPTVKAELTVSLMRDLPALADISLPGQGPLRTPSPPTTSPLPAQQLPTPGGPSSTTAPSARKRKPGPPTPG